MEVRSYNRELAICNLLFQRLFSNIKIERVDKQGKSKLIPVSCQLGKRSRLYKSWQNAERMAQIKLPMIIIERTGYSRDTERLNNIHNEVKYEVLKSLRVYDYLTPIPISISYEVTILSKYPSDIDQIASNFMIFFNSSLFVSCIHPKYDGIKMNNQVIMEDSISEDHPDELDGSSDDIITSTFSFTLKTFLFGGLKQAKKKPLQVLSSFVKTYAKNEVVQISPEDIDKFQEENPNASVSATLSSIVTEEVSEYVDSSVLSDQVYDDFVPIIKKLNVGFYPTPYASAYEEHIYAVDNEYEDVTTQISGYVRSTGYLSGFETYVDDDGVTRQRLSSVTPNDMLYEEVDSMNTLDPYVERKLVWDIIESN